MQPNGEPPPFFEVSLNIDKVIITKYLAAIQSKEI